MKADTIATAISRCMTGNPLQSVSKIFTAILLKGSIFVLRKHPSRISKLLKTH